MAAILSRGRWVNLPSGATSGGQTGPTDCWTAVLALEQIRLFANFSTVENQVQLIDAWYQNWKVQAVYFWIKNIDLYVDFSVCNMYGSGHEGVAVLYPGFAISW